MVACVPGLGTAGERPQLISDEHATYRTCTLPALTFGVKQNTPVGDETAELEAPCK